MAVTPAQATATTDALAGQGSGGFLSDVGDWFQGAAANPRHAVLGALSGISPQEMGRHIAVTGPKRSGTGLRGMAEAGLFDREWLDPYTGAKVTSGGTKGPGGYLQLSAQDIQERSPDAFLGANALLGLGYQGATEALSAATGQGSYGNIPYRGPGAAQTALSDAWQNYLGLRRGIDPDAPTVQEQAYIPPQFRMPDVDYTPATPIRNVARTHLSYGNTPVLTPAEHIRMNLEAGGRDLRTDAQIPQDFGPETDQPRTNLDGTITYLTNAEAMASDVQRALDRAGRIGPTPPVTAPEAQLQALTELAQTDPTIAERYTDPGSQDLIDIATQQESFANIPETPWTPQAPVIPDISEILKAYVPPPAAPEPDVETFEAPPPKPAPRRVKYTPPKKTAKRKPSQRAPKRTAVQKAVAPKPKPAPRRVKFTPPKPKPKTPVRRRKGGKPKVRRVSKAPRRPGGR